MASWIVTPQPRPAALASLLIAPHAGASANFFHKWIHHLPETIELHLLELPGRGRRMGEPLISHWRDAVVGMREELSQVATRPFAVFGHSMGAHLGYRALLAQNAAPPQLVHFFPSSARSPTSVSSHGFFAARPVTDEEIVAHVRAIGGANEVLFQHDAFLQLMLKVLRADAEICASLADAGQAPGLDCDVTAIGGRDDSFIDLDRVAEWRSVCLRRFELATFAGGHFYLDQQISSVVNLISSIVLRAICTSNCRFLERRLGLAD